MYGIFVNENGCIKYAELITQGYKPVETRAKNMLANCVGHRVAIIRTRRNKKPTILGYADMVKAEFNSVEWFNDNFNLHGVPSGSLYDCHGKGKWCYWFENAETCTPYELPKTAIRHGRSWCEF